ncbi:Antiviral protein [Mycena indigotica]|uniref:Antiviral protein n=1 Tax=Mycena indigotica TaxID=2126181 RepID=A0A8H6TDJ9_9AGAR|nr:Antiviral protein [Mycena indigotica]KAF7315319.1 Antiviral protein [Mycena indigotica]
MSLVKTKLKAARDAIAKKQFSLAKDASEQALAFDPTNYNANVFLGLALLELGEFAESEAAYRRAIDSSPEQSLAWQGLAKYYERRNQWPAFAETMRRLVDLYVESGDAAKCAEAAEKLIACRRDNGNPSELVDALSLLLPDSPAYGVLSNLPIPDHTNPEATPSYTTQAAVHNSLPVVEEIITILEREESSTYAKEVAKRRTRLGAASPEVLRKEVGVEVWSDSLLPKFYTDVLNHPHTTDELRRMTDAKLLRYKYQLLCALPANDTRKPIISREVDELVAGAITLEIPDELAWSLSLDALDLVNLKDYPSDLLQQFILLFPSTPLATFLKAYSVYSHSENIDEEDSNNPIESFERMQDAYSSLANSTLATRILADVSLQESELQNAILAAENGLSLLTQTETNCGKTLSKGRIGFKMVLSTSLVHLFPPKHHVRALSILDDVLAEAPDNTLCLMSRAYILEHEERWIDAATLFNRVSTLLPDDLQLGIRAKEEESWCIALSGDLAAGIHGLETVLTTLKTLEGGEADCARTLYRIGRAYWDMGESKREESYRLFIAALKYNSSYAPAFSALGIYYLEAANPRDPTRASKCFQKAFELDARESAAARRLADGFAEEREWDLVEVVARRTIEGEGGLDGGLKVDSSRRFLPNNAWAWKAVGVVELARSNYTAAIQALQITLRAEPDDQVSWLRLGEAYSKAGRHAAAIKALSRARELDSKDWMCSFFLAQVQRQTGELQEAVDAFRDILAEHPEEIGVVVSLGQSYLELGLAQLNDGLSNRAERSFVDAILTAIQTMKQSAGFRSLTWKTVADALFFLSRRSVLFHEDIVRETVDQVQTLLPTDLDSNLRSIMATTDPSAPITPRYILQTSVMAYSHRIALGPSEGVAHSSAMYDLGIVLLCAARQEISPQGAQDKAVEYLTGAVRENPGNDAFWTALASAHFTSQPKTSQHAYIKALEIDSKNALTWANLGLLYLDQGDLELANQALLRAQTLDPECTIAWAGQALVAANNGHNSDSTTLLEHAVGLPSSVPEVDLEYASRAFTQGMGTSSGLSIDSLLPIFLVLDRYCQNRPGDPCGLHLLGLICETLGQLERAVELVRRAIGILEAEYEETESAVVEKHYTVATSNAARLCLAVQDYEGAIEAFESVLGLIGEEDKDRDAATMQIQARFGISLAAFQSGRIDEAMQHAELALQLAANDTTLQGHSAVLLAQIMWAAGDKDTAKERLLDCITTDSENLIAITALAAMGILTNDDGLVDAALADILSLPVHKRLELDPERHVNYLLTKHHLAQNDVGKAISLAQGVVVAEPARPDTRNDLASLNLQLNDHKTAHAVLSGSQTGSFEVARNSLALQAISESMNGDSSRAIRLAQKAIFLTPWKAENWKTLALAR